MEETVGRREPETGSGDVGDIMTRLEAAIATGNHKQAAILAKEVSKMKISKKLSQQESTKQPSNPKPNKVHQKPKEPPKPKKLK